MILRQFAGCPIWRSAPSDAFISLRPGGILSCLFGQRISNTPRVGAETSDATIQQMLIHAILKKPEYHACGEDFRIIAQTMAEMGG